MYLFNYIKNTIQSFDKSIFYPLVFLLIIGILTVFSASVPTCICHGEPILKYLLSHLLWIVLGFVGLFWFFGYDYKKFTKYTILLGVFVIVLLLLLYTPLGVSIKGSTRWLNLGFIKFQPSELAKIIIIFILAKAFSLKQEEYKKYIPICSILIFSIIAIIYEQPNLSMALILLGTVGCMYMCRAKSIKGAIILISTTILILIGIKTDIIKTPSFLKPHQRDRIEAWKYPWKYVQGEGYQVFHSLIAISSGGVKGLGYGSSKEKLGYIPEAHNDFIFSIICEESGFFGASLVIGLFLILLNSGLTIAFRSNDLYGRLLAYGIIISITMQAFFHISVTSGFLPATGITLPFVSYGGSSLMVSMWMIGILLNISHSNKKNRKIYI